MHHNRANSPSEKEDMGEDNTTQSEPTERITAL